MVETNRKGYEYQRLIKSFQDIKVAKLMEDIKIKSCEKKEL